MTAAQSVLGKDLSGGKPARKKSGQAETGQAETGRNAPEPPKSGRNKSKGCKGTAPKIAGAELWPEWPPLADETALVSDFYARPAFDDADRPKILRQARQIASKARRESRMMSAEKIMSVYKLSTAEGRMIMELAEALLRVPDTTTRDFLIFDKLAPGHWLDGDATGFMRGMESALAVAGGIIRHRYDDGLKTIVSRLGVSTVRRAIEAAMRQMGGQFVFAETIEKAVQNAAVAKSLFSYDMLGEAARSAEDCDRYFAAYAQAIAVVGAQQASTAGHRATASTGDVHQNSGVSVKLSALSCRFQPRYWPKSHKDLIDRVTKLALAARHHNIPLTIDAEEFSRLMPSLHVFQSLLTHPDLTGWPGLGIVVQAYGRAAGQVIDWLEATAKTHNTRIAVRLVKGAYWDSEIKIAQEKGLTDFPVFTAKNHTDLAYLAHAKRLMGASQHIHPQFASHNAYTLAAVAHLAETCQPQSFELQKLHGMGDAVHHEISQITAAPLRVYAPVGRHHDLLAYLVRRILENGASSSFMNQFADSAITIENLVNDPYTLAIAPNNLPTGDQIFLPDRKNSQGFDDADQASLQAFAAHVSSSKLPPAPRQASLQQVSGAFQKASLSGWSRQSAAARANVLDAIADYYEQEKGAFFHLLVHEAGKTIDDAAGELREAVDFCRYYAAHTRQLTTHDKPRGTVVAISPWNFPLAIFTGQIVAALGAGNAVLAKPAEQTPRIAALAVSLMHKAGIPQSALHLLCGSGGTVGTALTKAGQADMVVFTGSTATAKLIEDAIAKSTKPAAPLIAETGGLNAMIVDSSALLERAVDDVLASAFRSAGQRCSALRILYVQDDIAADLTRMISAAAAMLTVGDAAHTDTDIGPVIDQAAKAVIDQHVDQARADGRLIWQGMVPAAGCFCPPAIIKVGGIADLKTEIFGPVLHIATYRAGDEMAVVAAINAAGYGLTFGMHSRIDTNIEAVSKQIRVGNIYINRNQIGAVVGSQPFGGHGLSGTGPKAGGRLYMRAFLSHTGLIENKANRWIKLAGPSGESNSYKIAPRGKILVVHPDSAIQNQLGAIAAGYGNQVARADKLPADAAELAGFLAGFDAVMTTAYDRKMLARLRRMLSGASDRIIPVISDSGGYVWLQTETHICRDMTASGGNIDLLMK